MRVSFLTHTVFHYRQEFHERVRTLLAADGIEYEVIYGQPDRNEAKKADSVELSFGRRIRNRYSYVQQPPLVYQPAMRRLMTADLAIIIQENRLLVNYALQSLPRRLRPKIALFGHGRNFQSRSPEGRSESWKKRWASKCDWWFGYTEETRRHVESLGFPPDRITVFNNAIDTTMLRELASQASEVRLEERRRELDLSGGNVGIYVGGLYSDKRLSFLVGAAERVRDRVPDFELLIIGAGPSEPELRALAETRPWIKLAGARFGADKVELMSLGKLFLMPGLLGLAILDAGVLGLPMVTTAFPWHSPEIAYLEEGVNGLKVLDWENAQTYADAVTGLLLDPPALDRMAHAARDKAACYTIEAMAERFAGGVRQALARPRREDIA
jgi:glycosyltransferase involved in cell wall biosynthesis